MDSEKNPPLKDCKEVGTQTCLNLGCPISIQEICGLCRQRVLSVSSPNDIPVEEDLPDTICQCFFSTNDVPEEESFDNVPGDEQNAEVPNVEIDDSQNVNLQPVEEESGTEEINRLNNNASSGEESNVLEHSFSSNGYALSPSEMSFDPCTYRRRTSIISDKSSKDSPNAEKSPSSSGYALSPSEQSLDQNLSDQRNIESPCSRKSSKKNSNTEKVSSGYPLSLGEQSSNENATNSKKKSSSSNDSKRNSDIEKDETNVQSLCENVEHLNVNEYKFNESISNDCGEKNDNQAQREYNFQPPFKVNSNVHHERSIPAELAIFKSENTRPALPPPFQPPYPQYCQTIPPTYQPHRNPAINMSMSKPSLPRPQHYAQSVQPYGNAAMNMPINRSDIPGRFPVVSRPQMNTSYHQPQSNEGNESCSKMQLPKETEEDPKREYITRVQNWLVDLEPLPPDEETSAYEGWSVAQNEECEGIPPDLSGTFTDERSSTEISEEETRRQRSLRRPPRKYKKK